MTSWTDEEDKKLLSLVKKYGENWSEIAPYFHGKHKRDCISAHWRLTLSPTQKTIPFTESECWIIFLKHDKEQKDFKYLQKLLPGRSITFISKHCKIFFRDTIKEYEDALRASIGQSDMDEEAYKNRLYELSKQRNDESTKEYFIAKQKEFDEVKPYDPSDFGDPEELPKPKETREEDDKEDEKEEEDENDKEDVEDILGDPEEEKKENKQSENLEEKENKKGRRGRKKGTKKTPGRKKKKLLRGIKEIPKETRKREDDKIDDAKLKEMMDLIDNPNSKLRTRKLKNRSESVRIKRHYTRHAKVNQKEMKIEEPKVIPKTRGRKSKAKHKKSKSALKEKAPEPEEEFKEDLKEEIHQDLNQNLPSIDIDLTPLKFPSATKKIVSESWTVPECYHCRKQKADCAFSPCGHLKYCCSCAKYFKYCPLCKTELNSTLDIHFN
ncbi:MAG: hypothetical protein MJ252_27920 [archaeon]|nr:hypothetical protein [archaeon]